MMNEQRVSRISFLIMSVIILAFIVAYVFVVWFQPRYLLSLVVVSGVAVLLVGLPWLRFGYPSFAIPLQALLFPDRVYKGLNVSIPLPPHTVRTGRCTETGSYYYSRSTLKAIQQFYRSLPLADPGVVTNSRLEIKYGTSVIIAVQRSPRVSQLAIGCQLDSSVSATDNP